MGLQVRPSAANTSSPTTAKSAEQLRPALKQTDEQCWPVRPRKKSPYCVRYPCCWPRVSAGAAAVDFDPNADAASDPVAMVWRGSVRRKGGDKEPHNHGFGMDAIAITNAPKRAAP